MLNSSDLILHLICCVLNNNIIYNSIKSSYDTFSRSCGKLSNDFLNLFIRLRSYSKPYICDTGKYSLQISSDAPCKIPSSAIFNLSFRRCTNSHHRRVCMDGHDLFSFFSVMIYLYNIYYLFYIVRRNLSHISFSRQQLLRLQVQIFFLFL